MGNQSGTMGRFAKIFSIFAALGAAGCAGQTPGRTHHVGTAPHALRSKLFHQLRYHQAFPATRTEVVDGLAASAELDRDERSWVQAHLDQRVGGPAAFATGAEVLVALFPDAPATSLQRLAQR